MLIDSLKEKDIILASGSPRRKLLLEEMGISFCVETRSVKENFPEGLNPREVAVFLSRLKSNAFKNNELIPDKLLITADTVVASGNTILGKPTDENDAFNMLKILSGKSHDVITGITLRTAQKERSFFASTTVYFSNLSDELISYYITHYKPYDKAGAYGIQEWIGHVAIERIEGSYFNVMGLPTHKLYTELISFTKKE